MTMIDEALQIMLVRTWIMPNWVNLSSIRYQYKWPFVVRSQRVAMAILHLAAQASHTSISISLFP